MVTPSPSPVGTCPKVLWFYGADAVGKSTIGWEAYTILCEHFAGVAYIDTDYLSFCHPAPDNPTGLVAANLRGVWSSYRERGVDQLVVSGIVVSVDDRDGLTASIPEAQFTFCRLTASPETVRRRIVARREAEAATQNVVLDPDAYASLEAYGQRSIEFAALLERIGLEDFVLSTDAGTPQALAAEAVRRCLADSPPLPDRQSTPSEM